ncbi:hypothetical protein ACJMK2_020290 [Sinanodonta woodiana]|uniref:FAM65 N-terminal domain-containing protein n=1 Tax=Sinanodonta woodiana TaxID=1069815 RepID=A0ABD3U1H6_SINWO
MRIKGQKLIFLPGRKGKHLHNCSAKHGEMYNYNPMTREDPVVHHNGNGYYNSALSIQDTTGNTPATAIGVSRSKSFYAGMAASRQNPVAPGSPSLVLGDSFRHHRSTVSLGIQPKSATAMRATTGFSFKKSPKVPKVPRPNRAFLMFHSVKKGIREFIEATKVDITQLQFRDVDGTATSTSQQIKAAERYLKRLEFHLSKLDELHDYYILQQQLREGVKTMHRAYVTSPGNQKGTLTNVKYGYKECTQNMCAVEAHLENMMGTFHCKLKGIAGFARLCPGDHFEVTIRHGNQKWKTRGRVEKSGSQKWDVPEHTFKAVIGDILNIKGVELRSFKSIVLGQKNCETKELFSANPQLMTVSLNVNGSLKLSLVISWNPLEGVDESATFFESPLSRPQGTPRRRPVSVITLNGEFNETENDNFNSERRLAGAASLHQTKDDNFILRTSAHQVSVEPTAATYHGSVPTFRHSEYYPGSVEASPWTVGSTDLIAASASFSNVETTSETVTQAAESMQSTGYSQSLPPVFSFNLYNPKTYSSGHIATKDDNWTLEEVIQSLSSTLEDYHGQYRELQKLEDLIISLEQMIRKHSGGSSRSSSISVSIENALGAFDFLDSEEALNEPTESPPRSPGCTRPESTAKTGDSGIESLAQRLSEDTQLGSSLGSSPLPPSTGSEQVDHCLMFHLCYCERLLENLGVFGPLKCKEIYALDKLQKQADVIESLIKIAKSSSAESDLLSVMSSLSSDKSLREFWVKCTDNTSLYIYPDRLVTALERKYGTMFMDKYNLDPVRVCQHLVTRILNIPVFNPNERKSTWIITLHQFILYFQEEGGLKHVEDVADEMRLMDRLTSGIPDSVIKTILTLRDQLPSAPCLKIIGTLLIGRDKDVEQCAISYLNLIQKKKENREKALIVFVEGLEDKSEEIRRGACASLAVLEASESSDLLVYVSQTDTSVQVQFRAKEALLSLGAESTRAFEESQLSRHGFQGLQVYK